MTLPPAVAGPSRISISRGQASSCYVAEASSASSSKISPFADTIVILPSAELPPTRIPRIPIHASNDALMTSTRMPASAARSLRVPLLSPKSKSFAAAPFALRVGQVKRTLANIREFQDRDVWFSNSIPCPQVSDSGPGSGKDHKPPDERTLKLGKSRRHPIV